VVNLGGRLPDDLTAPTCRRSSTITSIMTDDPHFVQRTCPKMIIEPGRSLACDAGLFETESC